MVATISRIVRTQQLALPQQLSPAEFARLVEMAMYAAKSQYPAMQPAEAFLKDMAVMVRTPCAGAKPKSESKSAPKSHKPPVTKAALRKKPTRRTTGGHP